MAGRSGRDELLAHLRTLKRSLYPYQREGVRRFFEEERLLLADDMGLGKTTQAVAACHALFKAGRVSRRPAHRAGVAQAAVGARVAGDDRRPHRRRRGAPRGARPPVRGAVERASW